MGIPKKKSAETFVKDIRNNTRRIFTAEQKILIVMEALRAEISIAELCRKYSTNQSQFYKWNKEFLEAGKKRLSGDVTREATSGEVAENNLQEGEIERLTYDFSTSTYKKFINKVESIRIANHNFIIHSADVISLSNSPKDGERFDESDLLGNIYTANKPLVEVEALLDDPYFSEVINPILYSKLPVGGVYTITHRDISQYGLQPVKAISINNYYINSVQNDINHTNTATYFPYEYNLPLIYKQDLFDIRNQIANDLANGKLSANHSVYNFLGYTYKFMREGKYNILMKYTIPRGKSTSESTKFYKNLIR